MKTKGEYKMNMKMNNSNEIIFPTAEEMAGRTAAGGLEKLITVMKESARKGHTSVITHDKKEVSLISQKEAVLGALGYVVLIHHDYVNHKRFAELIWKRKIR